MDWKAANEQQQEAQWRVFLMFVVMALLIIRTGLASRKRRGQLIFFPPAPALKRHGPSVEKSKLSPYVYPSVPPADLRWATLILLCLAEVAGRLFIQNAREVWELMNQPLLRPVQGRPLDIGSLCEPTAQSLDTS